MWGRMIVRKLSGVISCFKPSKIVDEGKATVSAGQAGNAAARGSALDGLPPRSRLPSAVPRNPAAQVAAPITDKQENAKRHVRLRAPLPNKSPFAVQKAGNEKNVSPPNESALSAFPRAGGSSANPFKALSNAGEKPCLRNFDDADVKWLIASLDKVKVPTEQGSGSALLDHALHTPNADRALGTYGHCCRCPRPLGRDGCRPERTGRSL